MLLAGDMSHVVDKGISYNIMVEKYEGMRHYVRLNHTLLTSLKTEWEGVDWVC
jgi:hypothetical protein